MKHNKNCDTVGFGFLLKDVEIPRRKMVAKVKPDFYAKIFAVCLGVLLIGCAWGQYRAWSSPAPAPYRGYHGGQMMSSTDAVEEYKKYFETTVDGKKKILDANATPYHVRLVNRDVLFYSKEAYVSGFRKYSKATMTEIERRLKNAS